MSHCFTHSPCVCRDAQAKKSVADKITHPHAALSQADCMRMVKQLQDQLDEVCRLFCECDVLGSDMVCRDLWIGCGGCGRHSDQQHIS
jgi:hypothetical protein